MKNRLKIKLLLYRLLSTDSGKLLLKLLSFGVKVRNLSNGKKSKKCPFLIAITTDTESGYVDKNERRIWQKEDPEAFIGCYQGIKNFRDIFDKYKIKTTFFLSTHCFSSKGMEYYKIKQELNAIIKKGHEIGLHLHPDSDLALQEKLSKKFNATSAFFYTYEEKLKIIKAAKGLIEKHLGKAIGKKLISFRWGNWALDTGGVKALNKLGFKIDSSAKPGIKGHLNDTMKYDWTKVNEHYPWKLSLENYQSIKEQNSNILEIPIATFDFFGFKLEANPVYSQLLTSTFKYYYKNANRNKPFIFVIMSHSSEGTYKNGEPTKVTKQMENFIRSVKKYKNVRFVTLAESYKNYMKSLN